MTCEDCKALVGDYVDGTLDTGRRRQVEAHLVECEPCRRLAADLAAIRTAAHGLERHEPPAHVWTRLAAAVAAERTPRRPAWQRLALAASVVIAVGASSWLLWRQMSVAPADPRVVSAPAAPAADPELVQSVETELRLAEEHYQKAIAGLEQITRSESAALDPQVAAVLQKNLEVIDQAIGESRSALQTQPTSEVAQESLFEALRNKVSLLQDTVGLINEMRKGNQEGAARIVSGLNQ